MKRVFILKGLDCPNCSAKIEKEVGALPGVESSVVNLMQQTLTVQSEKSADAAQAESYSNHPIAKSILATYGKPIDQKQFSDFEEISGHGISVMVQGKKVLAGNSKLMESEKIAYAACDAAGTKFYVAADAEHRDCSWHQERVPCSGRTRHGRYVGSRVR